MPSMASVAPSGQSSPYSATSARRPPSQADSESSRRPSRSKMTARIKRGIEESNLALWFWRPSCYRYTNPPWLRDCSRSVRRLGEHAFVSWRPEDPESYSYLLGMYLGDGWAGTAGRSARLMFTLDVRYAGIVDATAAAIRRAAPQNHVT